MMSFKIGAMVLACVLAAGCATVDRSGLTASRAQCDNDDGALTPDQQIAACNAAVTASSLYDEELPWIYSDRAKAYASRQSFDLAIADVDQAQKLLPDNEVLFFLRGIILAKAGETDKAEAAYDEAIRLNPRIDTLFLGRGKFFHKQRKYKPAIADFTAALKLTPSNTEARFMRARSYISVKAPVQAVTDLDALVLAEPADSVMRLWRGRARLDAKDHAGAVADLTEAYRLDPELTGAALYWRGRAYQRSGDNDHALADFDEAVRLEPDRVDALSSKCWGRLWANRELDVGLAACDAALKIEPDNIEAQFYSAAILLRKGDAPGAVRAFDTCAQTGRPEASPDVGPKAAYEYSERDWANIGVCLYGRGLAKLRIAGDNATLRAEADRELLVASAALPEAASLFARLGFTPGDPPP